MTPHVQRISLITALLITAAGCHRAWEVRDTGQPLQRVATAKTTAEDLARLCHYHSTMWVPYPSVYSIEHHGVPVGALTARSGFCYDIEPGVHAVTTRFRPSEWTPPPTGVVVFRAEPGQTYFLLHAASDALGRAGERASSTHNWVPASEAIQDIRGVPVSEVSRAPAGVSYRKPIEPIPALRDAARLGKCAGKWHKRSYTGFTVRMCVGREEQVGLIDLSPDEL